MPEDSFNRLNGLYLGKVLKHLQHGKCKVFIYGVYDDQLASAPDLLPDAVQITPLFGGSVNGNGVFSYPDIGAMVMCQFLNGDQNMPVMLGAMLGSDMAKQKYREAAPELDGDTGKEPAYVHVINAGRSKIKLNEGGQIELQVNGARGKSCIILDTEGNIFLECTDTLQIKAKNIKTISQADTNIVTGGNAVVTAGTQCYVQAGNIQLTAPDGNVMISSADNQCGREF